VLVLFSGPVLASICWSAPVTASGSAGVLTFYGPARL